MSHIKTACRHPIHQGPAAWNTILRPQSDAEVQNGTETADFVIIGGGLDGLSGARRLIQLQPGAKIVLLEAGRLAEAASGRNSGFMIDLPHDLASDDYAGKGVSGDRALISLNREAIAFARDTVAQYHIKADYFDEAGKVNGAATAPGHKHNLSYVKHLQALDETPEMLDAQQMFDVTGSRHYRSGLYTPGTVMLQPAGYIRGFGAGLRKNISLFENSPATGFSRVGRDWRVTTPSGSITTGRILLTKNGHLESFGYERGRLLQLFLYASMTPELGSDLVKTLGGHPRWGITPSDLAGTTMRRIDTGQGGNRIITRTCATLNPDMIPAQASVTRAAKVQQSKLDQRFPQLAGMRMEHQWAGHLRLSANAVSVMCEVENDVFTGCVQNGLSTARGTLTGIGAAELACGARSSITDFFTQEDRPIRLPPLAKVAGNVVLRLKEWRAGRE